MDRDAATVICQTEVSADDPAFTHPSKPIGSFMDEEMADRRRQQGWDLIEDSNRGWRRVVASPTPIRIVEMAAIRSLVDAGVVVITAGGGGIPVVADADGNFQGVPAVIDKDLATALLATDLGADLLVISTAIEQVALDFGKPEAALRRPDDGLGGSGVPRGRDSLRRRKHGSQGAGCPQLPRSRGPGGHRDRPRQRRAGTQGRDRHTLRARLSKGRRSLANVTPPACSASGCSRGHLSSEVISSEL